MRPLLMIALLMACATMLAACAGDDDSVAVVSTATPLPTDTPEASSSPAAETTAPSKSGATAEAPPPATPTQGVQARPQAPTEGRWIDVDVSKYTVRLMDGRNAVRTIGPVAVGREVDTGVYESTATGLFHVYEKRAALTYDAPYDTYIAFWVGFDPSLDNGFHSFLEDAAGKVVDSSTGNVSNGCIRTGQPDVVYSYAEVGMPVFVHA